MKTRAALTLMLLTATLAACGSSTPVGADSEMPKADVTWTEAEWSIVTPAGWTKSDITSSADAKKAIRYADAGGRYVIVAIDPLGSDFSYDALWRYQVTGSGFEIVDRYECAGAGDESCSDKDGRYDGYVLWKNGTDPQKVGGHVWYFMFGDAAKTSVDAAAFEKIIESVKPAA